MLSDGELSALEVAFDLGGMRETPIHLADGLMNPNWRLSTGRGQFALKRVIDVPVEIARRNLHVIGLLAREGIPVCAPVPSTSGDLVVEVGEHGYSLFPWVAGNHVRGTALTLTQAEELGALLGRIHRSLNMLPGEAGLPGLPPKVRASVEAPETALAEADRFACIIRAKNTADAFDERVLEFVEQRKVLVNKYAGTRPPDDAPQGPLGWTHGDYHHLNMIWRDGQVAAVLDWDRIRVQPLAAEVTRSAMLLFALDVGPLDLRRVTAFVSGYRRESPVTVAELADAVERLWWTRMCDFWQLVFHYDRCNHTTDHLFFSATALLHWWSDHRQEVQAAFAVA